MRKCKPIPLFFPGKCHGQRNLVSCSLGVHKEWYTTEWLSTHMHLAVGKRDWRWRPQSLLVPGLEEKCWRKLTRTGWSEEAWVCSLVFMEVRLLPSGSDRDRVLSVMMIASQKGGCQFLQAEPLGCKHGHASLSHFSHVWLYVTLWTIDRQTPLSMGFSRQEYCSGLPCPPPGSNPCFSLLYQAGSLPLESPGKPLCFLKRPQSRTVQQK